MPLSLLVRRLVVAVALACLAPSPLQAQPWSFGVMADTQWKASDGSEATNSVALGIIRQINRRFIEHGVAFVVQVGDLTDNGRPDALHTRATAAAELYAAGIGFFPLRGNHESTQPAAAAFLEAFPQTRGGGVRAFAARSFASPAAPLDGLTYAFDWRNTRLVLIDQFTRADGSGAGTVHDNVLDQIAWIDRQLRERPAGTHAFVFSHKNLVGQNHGDTLFGRNPSANPEAQNTFFGSLSTTGVRYLFSGHDHIHHRSTVASPDGRARVTQVIGASNSYKFYVPRNPSNDRRHADDFGLRERVHSQQLFTIGYYIVTIDGPKVTVDYYAAPNGCGGDCSLDTSPDLSFTRQERFGHSLGGSSFLVPPGGSFDVVRSRFGRATARMLGGINTGAPADHSGRLLTRDVELGWTAAADGQSALASPILTIWGMEQALGSRRTEVFTLSMSYDPEAAGAVGPADGDFGLAVRDDEGRWVAAVRRNVSGTPRFVRGPWTPDYELGTYGVDPESHTAWAVLDQNGSFAVAGGLSEKPGSGDISGWHVSCAQNCNRTGHALSTILNSGGAFTGVTAAAPSEASEVPRPALAGRGHDTRAAPSSTVCRKSSSGTAPSIDATSLTTERGTPRTW